MTLLEQLHQDSRDALRDREAGRLRLSVLRLAISTIRNIEIDQRRTLSDEEITAILQREVRQRQDTLAEIEGRGRDATEAQLHQEIAVLRAYLPQELSDGELERAVRAAIAEAGATSPGDMGKVMPLLMPRVRGRADGGRVASLVRGLLGG